jgi:hypothetical protein
MLGWKFVPTLLAVIHTQLTTQLFDDVKRTEPFARLACNNSQVPSASQTILETPRLWWVTLSHGFGKKRNGGRRSWTVILSCIVNVLAFMVISPLSSVLLNVEDIRILRPYEMTRLIPRESSALTPVAERDTYFRTISALLQNATTSPWVSDEYAILPFWPSNTSGSTWNPRAPSISQIWQAETTVYRNDLQCAEMKFAATDVWNGTESTRGVFRASVRLETSEGCEYNISLDASSQFSDIGILSWTDINTFADNNTDRIYNNKCNGNEVIFLSSTWFEDADPRLLSMPRFLSNLTVNSYICHSNHTMATIPVAASMSGGVVNVAFDVEEFRKSQVPVPEKLINHSEYQQFYTNPTWNQYVASPGDVSPRPNARVLGVSALLATQYEFNSTRMFTSSTIPQVAARIRKRQFGELLRSSLDDLDASQVESVVGQRIISERRITVKMEIAATLGALFVISSFMLLYVTWISRLKRRPLNLTHDPATVLGSTALAASNTELLSSLRGLDQATERELRLALRSRQYFTTPGQLHETVDHGQPTSLSKPRFGHLLFSANRLKTVHQNGHSRNTNARH